MFVIDKFKRMIRKENAEPIIAISENEIEGKILYVREILQYKKLPIVILDNTWYAIKEVVVNESILAKEKKLQGLLKEQGKLNTDNQEYAVVKQNYLKEVLKISEEINTNGDTKKDKRLDMLHDSILKTNEKMDEATYRLEEMQKEIEEVNLSIIEETVALGYSYMDNYKKKKIALDQEIDYLREQVVLKTAEKKQCEEKFGKLYNYMHKVVGYKYIDKVDRKMGNKEK